MKSFDCGMRGTVETAAVEAWGGVVKALRGARFLTVRRPLAEVRESLARFGLEANAELTRRDALLDEIELAGIAERVDFADLRQKGCRKWVWKYLLPEVPHDPVRDAKFEQTNIQVDMPARIEQLRRRSGASAKLLTEVRDAAD